MSELLDILIWGFKISYFALTNTKNKENTGKRRTANSWKNTGKRYILINYNFTIQYLYQMFVSSFLYIFLITRVYELSLCASLYIRLSVRFSLRG